MNESLVVLIRGIHFVDGSFLCSPALRQVARRIGQTRGSYISFHLRPSSHERAPPEKTSDIQGSALLTGWRMATGNLFLNLIL